MTGNFLLDWGIISTSLFNTIILFWLGLTVLFNSDMRRPGVWIAGSGLLMGGLFFIIHSAIVSNEINYVGRHIQIMWFLSWILLVLMPFSWYILILWYLGFWKKTESYLKKRHKYFFIFILILFLIIARFVLFTISLPSFQQFAMLDLTQLLSFRDIPILIILYPVFIVFCIIFSLDALRFPGPASRIMGDIARKRARPWLIATSVSLLMVSFLVTCFLLWIVFNTPNYDEYENYMELLPFIGLFDLLIGLFISVAILFLGQAITSYEIFTGKTLPRRGLFRNWLNIIFIASGYGIFVGAGLTVRVSPVYYLLLTTILMTLFSALFNWRFYRERERYMKNMRPFVTNQKLYEHLLVNPDLLLPEVDIKSPFYALCNNILEAKSAYLVPLGPLSTLVGGVLSYPENIKNEFPESGEIIEKITSPDLICIPVDPEKYMGIILVVPLWSGRGLIGLLMIGEKHDGGLYSQEEIELARSSGERLIDTKASSEMAASLMESQRKKLTESRLLDRKARRVLHDDILPLLHTAILDLNQNNSSTEAVNLIGDAHHQISDLLRDMPSMSISDIGKTGLIDALKYFIKNEMKNEFDNITWNIEEKAKTELEKFPVFISEVIFYAVREVIRNSAKYGREAETEMLLNLDISFNYNLGLEITLEDNGSGIRETSSKGGSGQGLALHSTMMAVIGGTLSLESKPGLYTKVKISLPAIILKNF